MSKITSIKSVSSEFADVKQWFDDNMAVDKIDLEDRKVYDYVYGDARWAGVFQCTSVGAQRLFTKAKPTSVLDIATLTSIYRPGPLAANVDKLYLKAKNEGEEIDWGDKRVNQLLASTNGCLIFQEQVMLLAEKVAGFPKDKCDEVRRAIMKRSISGGDAAKAKVDELQTEFVEGAIKNNGYERRVAENIYEKLAFFSGYGFNKSHALAYAIDSYWCAWLLTHHEEQWLTAYLESMSSSPENRTEAFGYVKKLGYQIVSIDINDAMSGWTVLPGKKFMPSFLSCKGIGKAAVDEIVANRPYNTIEELLWDDQGNWRHSKFNKRAMEALIKIRAFKDLDIVGEGKLFNSYKHMHRVIVEHQNDIKKTSKRDPHVGRKNFYNLIRDLAPETTEWTRKEFAEFGVEYFGSLDVMSMCDPEVLDKLSRKGVKPIDQWEGKDIYWLVVQKAIPKKTKNGKNYLLLETVGPSAKVIKIMAWGWDGIKQFEPYALCAAEVDRNDFGYSTTMWRVKDL